MTGDLNFTKNENEESNEKKEINGTEIKEIKEINREFEEIKIIEEK